MSIQALVEYIAQPLVLYGHWEYKDGNLSISIRAEEKHYKTTLRFRSEEVVYEHTCLLMSLDWLRIGIKKFLAELSQDISALNKMDRSLSRASQLDALRLRMPTPAKK